MYNRKNKILSIIFATSISILTSNVNCIAPQRINVKSKNTHVENVKQVQLVRKPNVINKSEKQIKSAKVSNKEIYRLAQLMYAENGSSKYDNCVLLTGIVVMKRVKSKHYPNSIEDVISQKGQYATYKEGTINCNPDERCLELAEEILRFNLQKHYPDNLIFQSEFKQGKSIYAKYGNEYFCLS